VSDELKQILEAQSGHIIIRPDRGDPNRTEIASTRMDFDTYVLPSEIVLVERAALEASTARIAELEAFKTSVPYGQIMGMWMFKRDNSALGAPLSLKRWLDANAPLEAKRE
jgi:hypothetical protein